MFRGNNDAFSNISQQTCRFTSTQNVDVYGNICSLLKSGDFQDYSLNAPYVFTHFFGGGASYIPHLKVVNASNLILPSGVITDNSCASMFDGCEELTSAPQLPARYVGQNGYSRMFAGCTSLTTAPELPATVVQSYGYQQMFSGCTNLVTAPSILYPKYLT